MGTLTTSELLLYGGIALMGTAVAAALIAILVFSLTGRSLKRRLEREYGKRRH